MFVERKLGLLKCDTRSVSWVSPLKFPFHLSLAGDMNNPLVHLRFTLLETFVVYFTVLFAADAARAHPASSKF